MGNCILSQNQQQKDDDIDKSVEVNSDDIPYDERTNREKIQNEMQQMINCMQRHGEI